MLSALSLCLCPKAMAVRGATIGGYSVSDARPIVWSMIQWPEMSRDDHVPGALKGGTWAQRLYPLFGEDEKNMQATRAFLKGLGLPPGDLRDVPTSLKRFPDGAQYRMEIPSVEGPRAMGAVLEEAEGKVGRALELIREAEGIFTELGSPYAAQARRDRESLEKKAGGG